MLYGIVQGGFFPDLRQDSAKWVKEMDFDANAIGGVAIGETREEMYIAIRNSVPFLDKEFVDLYCSIPPELLMPNETQMEKYLIRKAFEEFDSNILPTDVLWRKKEAFSDGVSSTEDSWFMTLKNYFNILVTDEEFETRDSIPGIKPLCKESFYYRKKFTEFFGDNHQVIPRYWLPNWSKTKDPSARTL